MGVPDLKGGETSHVGEAGRDPPRLGRALQESGVIGGGKAVCPHVLHRRGEALLSPEDEGNALPTALPPPSLPLCEL